LKARNKQDFQKAEGASGRGKGSPAERRTSKDILYLYLFALEFV
jgi:hypothetical protein